MEIKGWDRQLQCDWAELDEWIIRDLLELSKLGIELGLQERDSRMEESGTTHKKAALRYMTKDRYLIRPITITGGKP